MKHLTDEQLTAYLDGAFRGRDAEEAGRHLATCQPCSEALAELAAQDESLKPALVHDPGEAYFERFAARVGQRIGAPGTSRARPRGALDMGRWFGSPRALAWAGGVAVVVVGGGLALMTSRDGVLPGMRDRNLATRLERSAPSQAKQAPSPGTQHASPPAPRPSVDGARQTAPSADAGPAPVPSGVETDASSPAAERSPAFAPPPGDAKARADAPADARLVRPSRAFEVRRNEAGEEVPVRAEVGSRVVPAPSVVPPGGADQATQVRKKLVAEPLDALKEPALEQPLGATSPLAESGARENSFASPPPGRPAAGATRQAAPARAAEGEARWCGSVRDAANRPIAGAQVVLTDIGRTVTTDPTGRFCVTAPPGEHPLSVMAVGYRESRQTVRAEGGADIQVTLAAVSVLDEKGTSVAGRGTPGRGAPSTAARDQPLAESSPEAKDGFSALPDTLRGLAREAQRIEADAAARRSAAHYDLAAGAWERALRRLANGPLEIETRRHLAESRYHAWAIGPNARRTRAAVEALTAYLTRAPAGPDRDQAARWLDRVRP